MDEHERANARASEAVSAYDVLTIVTPPPRHYHSPKLADFVPYDTSDLGPPHSVDVV